MKDAVYSASSVEEALDVASRGLGVSRAELRYVVLDPGSEDRAAQIAVLLDAMRTPRKPAAVETESAGSAGPRRESPSAEPAPRAERMRRWFEALAEVSDPLDVEIEDSGESGVRVRVLGEPPALEPEEWTAFEMLLRRAFGPPRVAGRIAIEVPGRRESREHGLRQQAQDLAAAVRQDGEARTTEPLNSYERRLVHVAVAELGGLVTESQGEGALRSVTIRLSEASAEA